MNKAAILVTGASGFLGWNLCRLASEKYTVYGTFHDMNLDGSLCRSVKCDLTIFAQVKKILDEVRPQAVFHLAALSDPNACQLNANLSKSINIEATIRLAGLCAERDIDFVFTSTDLVFDGQHGSYKERDTVNPVNLYGEHKALAEEALFDNPVATICRMPLMYGLCPSDRMTLLQGIYRKLKNTEMLNLFSDEFRTVTSGICAAQGLLLAHKSKEKLLHLGGPQALSRMEIGQIIADVFDLPESLLKASLQKEISMAAARPANVSLDSSLANSLGFKPLSLESFCRSLSDSQRLTL
ncbi:MAG: SDR family oxidoreductase [Lentisphaeraceae bacterium]|nr:SDR family oxidoreductase [Lentisphaeraceae bacterium]